LTQLPFEFLKSKVLPDLLARDVHILVTSTPAGLSGDPNDLADYKIFLNSWLSADSKNLFIYAIDNNMTRLTLQSVASTPDPRLKASDQAVAQLLSTYPDQILLVAGSDPGTTSLWQWSSNVGSGFWQGGISVVAPGDSVLVLTRPDAIHQDSVRLATGNSYAAP